MRVSVAWRPCAQAIESAPLPADMPSMAQIEDCAIPGAAGPIPLRIYRPSTESGRPVLVYFHGGGLVMGSNHSFEPLAQGACAAVSDATVVSVDYRLAPENPAARAVRRRLRGHRMGRRQRRSTRR